MNLYGIIKRRENIDEYLLEKEGEYTEEILSDLDITEQTKDQVLKEVFYEMLEEEDSMVALINRINMLQELKKSHEKRIETRKKLLSFALKVFGNQNVDEFKLSLGKSKYVNATNLEDKIEKLDLTKITTALQDLIEKEIHISSALVNVGISLAPKKTEIKASISAGVPVPGAEVLERSNLRIK